MPKKKKSVKLEQRRWEKIEEILKTNPDGLSSNGISSIFKSMNPRRNCWVPSAGQVTFLCNKYGAEKFRNRSEFYWRIP